MWHESDAYELEKTRLLQDNIWGFIIALNKV